MDNDSDNAGMFDIRVQDGLRRGQSSGPSGVVQV